MRRGSAVTYAWSGVADDRPRLRVWLTYDPDDREQLELEISLDAELAWLPVPDRINRAS